MALSVLVTGGTGTLGQRLVPRLTQAGCEVRVLTRSNHANEDGVHHVTGDLATGAGLAAAVDGAEAVVHCAGGPSGDDALTRTLVRAITEQNGTPHLVYISVVGADRVPVHSAVDRAMFRYFASKLATEAVVAQSGLPWTTLRATQFHDLMLMVARQLARLPVVPVPTGTSFQPVDTDEVAGRLVELVLAEPAGLVADLAGPQVRSASDRIKAYLHAVGRRRPLVPVRLPGAAARAVRCGANLAPDHATGIRTWEDFLAAHVHRS